jgi:hypothetical protein
MHQWPSWKLSEAFILCHQFHRSFAVSGGSLSTASRSWTLASTRRSWFSSHRSCGVNCFSKQFAIALAFSDGWNVIPKGPWIAVGALGPSLFMRSFGMGHFVWGVISVSYFLFPLFECPFVGHASNCFRDPIKLHPWFLVTGSLTSFCVLATYLNQEYHCLFLKL